MWPSKRTDRTRLPRRASELKFQQKRPMMKSRTWCRQEREDKKRAGKKLIRKDCGKKEEPGDSSFTDPHKM
jgi:hypothetical protein